MNQYGFPCPTCGSGDIRRSRRQDWLEIPKMLVGIYPFRCLKCGDRFFGNVWILATGGNANCPQCLRLDVKPSTRTEAHLKRREKFMLAMGAHMYRCVPCRLNFLSFRRCSADVSSAG
jgi:DNA-directed RNA polymerase subunit RPC12/RpoP